MKSHRLTGLITLLTLLVPAAAAAQQRLDERLPASRDGTVKITSAIGVISVRGWQNDSVAVTGLLGDRAARLEFVSEGRETRIRAVLPSDMEATEQTTLDVQVPRGSHVAVRSSTADIQIRDVDGAVDLESVGGDIAVRGSPRMIYAETAGGDIEIEASERASTKVIRASSLNGSVTVSGARGYIDVSTVGGRAYIAGENIWEGEAKSVSGDVIFEGGFDPGGSFYFESHGGDIELRVPADSHIDFDVTSIYSGRVTNDFAAADERAFSIGGGGTRVRIKSFKGDIRILESPTAGG